MSDLLNFDYLRSFIAVADTGSFTRAADSLGLSKAMLSNHIKQLEALLGVALFVRTTRKTALTEVGIRFRQDCVKLLEDAHRAIDRARQDHAGLSGVLRVTSTSEYGVVMVVPALAEFARLHPALKIQFIASTSLLDLVEGRFDLAIRLGRLRDSRYRARPLAPMRLALTAAPAYLEQHGAPTCLHDLHAHRFIGHAFMGNISSWEFSTPFDGVRTIELAAHILTDSTAAMLSFVEAGAGLAVLPDFAIAPALAQGRLVILLPDHTLPPNGVFAVYPDTQHLPAKVRAFIDFLRARLKTSSHTEAPHSSE